MIEDDVLEQDDPTQELEPAPASDSLASRMQARADALAKHTTERFVLPGFEGVLEVELRVSNVQAATRVSNRVQRVRDEGMRNLYVMADLLVGATVGFWEVPADEGEPHPIEDDWITLARRMPGAPANATPRQALLFLVKDHRVQWLYHDWEQWQRVARADDVETGVRRDFAPTG